MPGALPEPEAGEVIGVSPWISEHDLGGRAAFRYNSRITAGQVRRRHRIPVIAILRPRELHLLEPDCGELPGRVHDGVAGSSLPGAAA